MEVFFEFCFNLWKVSTLQWGHDKIVMEVLTLRAPNGLFTKLQWGHDKIVMEVGMYNMADLKYITASMGP